jgi:hypothetical protein
LNPEDQLNEILDTIEKRVATALELTADQVYESRQTGEDAGAAAYVQAQINTVVPHTLCAELATVEVLIGFHMPVVEGERDRVTRVRHTMRIRDQLLWRGANAPNAIPNVGLPRVGDMAVSDQGEADLGYLMGGLTYQFQTILQKPS